MASSSTAQLWELAFPLKFPCPLGGLDSIWSQSRASRIAKTQPAQKGDSTSLIHPNLQTHFPSVSRTPCKCPNSQRCPSQGPRISSMSILTQLALIPLRKPAHSLSFLHNIPPLITFSILNWQPPPFLMEPLLLYPPRLFRFPLPLSL